jgi:LDH2 family malate/lactate/ureidoglycolate dehydrogenase
VTTRTVSHTALNAFCVDLLKAAGVPESDAGITARIQVEADLRGVHSHGARGIAGYIRQILRGEINPNAQPRVLSEGAAYVHMDADNALGQVAAYKAMQRAIQKAEGAGIGMAAVRNTNHYGAAAYYVNMAVEAGMVGFNTTGGRKNRGNMAPYGSIEPAIGNAPFAYGIPAGRERPIILDMATGVVAAGKIGIARDRGEKIPLGWALDAAGQPTDDPREAHIVVPLGPKGSGLAIVMQCIGGILAGAAFPDVEKFGYLFIAINVSTFADPESFTTEVDTRIQTIREARPATGVDRVYYPGEPEWIARERNLENGIPMLLPHVTDLESVATELGVSKRLG